VRADFDRREPRCRICRDETVRSLVNELLDLRGIPIFLGRGRFHRITYAEILGDLTPFNEGRDTKDRITYDSLWVYAKRHYDLAGTAAYWRTQTLKEFEVQGGPAGMKGVGCLSNSPEHLGLSTKKLIPAGTLD
jgi:hypothetical protein